MSKLWLLVDDIRDAMGCDIVARNAKGARAVIRELNQHIECIIFDHDLGETETGYDVMKWMFDGGVRPKQIQLVTSNPVGRQNMENILIDNRYTTKDGQIFHRDNS